MHCVCLSTAYLAPVSYYKELVRSECVLVEQFENYQKQTYRNRMVILAESGRMSLSIPVEHCNGEKVLVRDLRLSDHGNWRHLHWQALQAAYDRSPFFEYYADDFAPFYEGRPTKFLLDFNLQLQELVCSLLNFKPRLELTKAYEQQGEFVDLRNAFSPKKAKEVVSKPYYQVFSQRYGFQSDLSIVDLLFNMGAEGLLHLLDKET